MLLFCAVPSCPTIRVRMGYAFVDLPLVLAFYAFHTSHPILFGTLLYRYILSGAWLHPSFLSLIYFPLIWLPGLRTPPLRNFASKVFEFILTMISIPLMCG